MHKLCEIAQSVTGTDLGDDHRATFDKFIAEHADVATRIDAQIAKYQPDLVITVDNIDDIYGLSTRRYT